MYAFINYSRTPSSATPISSTNELMDLSEAQVIDKKQLELGLEVFEEPKLRALLTVDEIFSRGDSILIRQLGEDRRIERKSALVTPRVLGDYFSMWANTPEGGLLVIGIEKNGTISGCKIHDAKYINDLENSPSIYCSDARHESKRIPVNNSEGGADFLLIFRIFYRDDKVVKTHKAEAFIRSGDKIRRLRDDEIKELQIDRGEIQFELEQTSLTYTNDLDKDLIREYISNVSKKDDHSIEHPASEILAQKRLCIKKGGKLFANNAAALLFAKDPIPLFPGCKLRFQRFEGSEEGTGENYNVVKDVTIEGPVPRIILESEKLIAAQLREYSALGKDGRFYSMPEYPKIAWYEAIVNACAHRSYNLRAMNIFVKMFDDKLVVISPGSLPPLVTPENIFRMHSPRNPFLMGALQYFGFVKCANEGTRRMRDAMKDSRLPEPSFRECLDGGGTVTVILHNNHKHRKRFIDANAAKDIVSAVVYKTLTEDHKRLINHVSEYETITVTKAATILERNWGTARKRLDELVTKGIFVHIHSPKLLRDPRAHYVLNKPD